MRTGIKTKKPAYEQLARELREGVANGTMGADGFVASEHELGHRYGLARATVRRATDILIAEGLIERCVGKGLFVRRRKGKAQKQIWVHVDNLARESAVRYLRRIQDWAQGYNLSVRVEDGHGDEKRNLALLRELAKRRDIDGALIMAWHTPDCLEALHAVKASGLPFVVVDHHNDYAAFPNVASDNYHGGHLVAEHLYGLGHRAFAFIGDTNTLTVRHRLDGFRDYLAEQGLALPHALEGNVRPRDRFADWGGLVEAQMRRIFESNHPTALFISCDNLARAVYRYCNEQGIRIPHDLSVVGFDNDPVAQWLVPELTTVEQPFPEIGDKAVELLDRQINGTPWDGAETILPVRLIVRNSTRAL